MILVVGATGMVGAEVCRQLRERGETVRAFVRRTGNPDTLRQLHEGGVEFAWGDLKDPASIRPACDGVDAIISTASATLSRQPDDSIDAVDRRGQIALIQTAREAGIGHFTLLSMPRCPARSSLLTRAKAEAEGALLRSGVPYTILACNFFMDVWLAPAMGLDFANHRAVLFGEGRGAVSWVSTLDVAEFAAAAHRTKGARNRILEIGGPDDLSQRDVVTMFETVTGAKFTTRTVQENSLLTQLESTNDPLTQTVVKLQLECAHGCLSDSGEARRLIPVRMTSVKDYAVSVTGIRSAAV